MDEKTNVMRILDKKKILYESHCYADTGAVSGLEVAETLGQNPSQAVSYTHLDVYKRQGRMRIHLRNGSVRQR